jgi:hypothetical protein
MPTIGVKLEVTISTEKTREAVDSFYKSFPQGKANINRFYSLSPSKVEVFDLIESSLLILTCAKYTGSPEVLEVTLVSGADNFLLRNTGFVVTDCSNIDSAIVKNISDTDVDIHIIY